MVLDLLRLKHESDSAKQRELPQQIGLRALDFSHEKLIDEPDLLLGINRGPAYLDGFFCAGLPAGFGFTLSSLCCLGGDESMRFRTSFIESC